MYLTRGVARQAPREHNAMNKCHEIFVTPHMMKNLQEKGMYALKHRHVIIETGGL